MYITPKVLKRSDIIRVTGIVNVHYYEFGKRFNFPEEHHDCYELGYIDHDAMDVTLGGVEYTIEAGHMLLYPPLVPHSLENTHNAVNSCGIAFTAHGRILEEIANHLIPLPEHLQKAIGRIITTAQKLHPDGITTENSVVLAENLDNNSEALLQLTALYIEEFFLLLALELPNINLHSEHNIQLKKVTTINNRTSVVDMVTQYIGKHIGESVTVDEICRQFSISKGTLYRSIREATGMGFKELVMQEKLKTVKIMIREENSNFTEIAERLGFNSLNYFSAWFKKMASLSPTDYASSVITKYKE